MEAYVRSAVAISLYALVACTAAAAEKAATDCGFAIDLPATMVIKRNADTLEPLCSYLDASSLPSPFVNSITVLPWGKLDQLRVNDQPLRDVGFFRLSPKLAVTYIGRPSYADPRNGYAQRVVKRPVKTRKVAGQTKTVTVRSELRVNWLKPTDTRDQEEAVEVYVCVDAATSNEFTLVLFNWCALKNDPNAANLISAAESLRPIER
jgi:hypothetical protein